MRNRLIHAYFSINLDIVWQTVQEDLPGLIAQLQQIATGACTSRARPEGATPAGRK